MQDLRTLHQLPRHAAYRARAHRDDDIAIARLACDGGRQRRNAVDELGARHRRCESAAVGAGDRRFARGVDLGQQHRIEAGEHADEIVEAVARARVAVRLEGEHQALIRERAARRSQHRGHLHRWWP